MGLNLGLGRSPKGEHGNPSSILTWRIPWIEEPGRPQPMGSQSQTRLKQLGMHTHTLCFQSLGTLTKTETEDFSMTCYNIK